MTSAIYTRISRDHEGKALGVQRQQQDSMALASGPVRVFSDNDISAFSGKRRPGYEAMMQALASGEITEIIAWAPDRLHRSPRELESFIDAVERHGVTVRTVQAGMWDLSTPAGRMTARTLGAVARYESEHKSARLRRKAQQLAEQGKRNGPVKYGWRSDDEAAVVRRIVTSLLAGDSLYRLRNALNAEGIPTAQGKRWTTTQVRAIAIRWSNAGLRTHHGEVVGEAEWEPLVSREQQEAVVRLLTDQARRTSPGSVTKHVLSGILRCGVCGAGMRHKSQSERASVYQCPDYHATVSANAVESFVIAQAQARLDAPDAASLASPAADGEREARARLDVLRGRLEGLAADYADGVLDREQVRVAGDRLRAEVAEVEHRLATMERRHHALADAGVDLAGLPLDRQRAVIRALLVPTVESVGRTGRGFDPERITVKWVS